MINLKTLQGDSLYVHACNEFIIKWCMQYQDNTKVQLDCDIKKQVKDKAT